MNSTELQIDSTHYLDSIVSFLNKNKNIKIKITCFYLIDKHQKSTIKSQKKAETIINYFIEYGINPSRLSTKGMNTIDSITENSIIKMKCAEIMICEL